MTKKTSLSTTFLRFCSPTLPRKFDFDQLGTPPSRTLFWARKQQTGRQIHLQSSAECDMKAEWYVHLIMICGQSSLIRDILVHLGQWCLNITWSNRTFPNLWGVYEYINIYTLQSYKTKIITYDILLEKGDQQKTFKTHRTSVPDSASRSLHNSAALWFRTAKAWPFNVRPSVRGWESSGLPISQQWSVTTTSLKPSMQVVLQNTLSKCGKIHSKMWKVGAFWWPSTELAMIIFFAPKSPSTWNLHQKEYQVESQPAGLQRCSFQPVPNIFTSPPSVRDGRQQTNRLFGSIGSSIPDQCKAVQICANDLIWVFPKIGVGPPNHDFL